MKISNKRYFQLALAVIVLATGWYQYEKMTKKREHRAALSKVYGEAKKKCMAEFRWACARAYQWF